MSLIKFVVLIGIGILLAILLWQRLLPALKNPRQTIVKKGWAYSQTTGNKELQSDVISVYQNHAGVMAALADGIGKENTGKISAQVAVDTLLDAFEPYRVLNNPEYLFRTAFLEAHNRIQKTIGERRGGASMGAIFANGKQLYYALAGNLKIALLRNGELIPISKGQTFDVLARTAFREGDLSKQETIWSQETTRVWNYLGKDGFHEIEVCTPPINLKSGDMIILVSQGVYEELSWAEVEDILLRPMSLQEMADTITIEVEKKEAQDKENGSVLLLVPEVTNEKNQF